MSPLCIFFLKMTVLTLWIQKIQIQIYKKYKTQSNICYLSQINSKQEKVHSINHCVISVIFWNTKATTNEIPVQTLMSFFWALGMCLKISCEWVESLWVRIRDWCNKRNLVTGVHCRLPDKGNLWMKPSCASYRRHCTHRLLSCWGISTTLISTGKMSWRAVGNLEHSWYVC